MIRELASAARSAAVRSLAVMVFFPGILIASVANYALPAFADSENADWPFAGVDLHNTANASKENKLGPDNVGNLAVKWILDTVGNVSATPAAAGRPPRQLEIVQ